MLYDQIGGGVNGKIVLGLLLSFSVPERSLLVFQWSLCSTESLVHGFVCHLICVVALVGGWGFDLVLAFVSVHHF